MGDLIRARQPIITRLFPHQANRRYMIPGQRARVAGPGQVPLGINGEDAYFARGCPNNPGWDCVEAATITIGAPGQAEVTPTGGGTGVLRYQGSSNADGLDWTVLMDVTAAAGEVQLYKFGIVNFETPNWQPPDVSTRYFYIAAGSVGLNAANCACQVSDVGGNSITFDFFTAYPGDWRSAFADLGFDEAT